MSSTPSDMIRFPCSRCGKKLKAAPAHAGRSVQCSGCGQFLVVPAAPPAAPSVHAPPPSAALDEQEEPPLLRPMHQEHDEGIDLTAMVDIVFFLLIFFMVTSTVQLQASIEMPTPETQDESAKGPSVQTEPQEESEIVILIDKDDKVWVNDIEAQSRQELLAKIRDAMADGGSSAVVQASGDSRHGTVVQAMDAATVEGLQNIRLATLGDDEE